MAVAYLAILLGLFIYGINFLWLTWVAVRRGPAGPPPRLRFAGRYVTVQLPIYNEMYVAERIIDAAARFDYPGELEIQVLDDSTDETVESRLKRSSAVAVARRPHRARPQRADGSGSRPERSPTAYRWHAASTSRSSTRTSSRRRTS